MPEIKGDYALNLVNPTGFEPFRTGKCYGMRRSSCAAIESVSARCHGPHLARISAFRLLFKLKSDENCTRLPLNFHHSTLSTSKRHHGVQPMTGWGLVAYALIPLGIALALMFLSDQRLLQLPLCRSAATELRRPAEVQEKVSGGAVLGLLLGHESLFLWRFEASFESFQVVTGSFFQGNRFGDYEKMRRGDERPRRKRKSP